MPARNCSITGGPALQYVRTHETPRVADTFHLFLLSLYESLAQAVNPQAPAAATAPNPRPPHPEAISDGLRSYLATVSACAG